MRDNNEEESKSVTVKLAQPRYIPPPLAKPVKVIGSLYCAPYPVDLSMVRKDYEYVVSDNVSGDMIFEIKEAFFTLRGKRVLLDSACNPIVTMQAKSITDSSRWQVYKGDSTDNNDLLFSVQRSSIRESSWTDLEVFLFQTQIFFCDFKIKGTLAYSKALGRNERSSCVVCLGHSSLNIAQMHEKCLDRFIVVNVNPHVDYAFIIALMEISQLLIPGQISCESKKDNISCESKDEGSWKWINNTNK